jgi:hypothetical protein
MDGHETFARTIAQSTVEGAAQERRSQLRRKERLGQRATGASSSFTESFVHASAVRWHDTIVAPVQTLQAWWRFRRWFGYHRQRRQELRLARIRLALAESSSRERLLLTQCEVQEEHSRLRHAELACIAFAGLWRSELHARLLVAARRETVARVVEERAAMRELYCVGCTSRLRLIEATGAHQRQRFVVEEATRRHFMGLQFLATCSIDAKHRLFTVAGWQGLGRGCDDKLVVTDAAAETPQSPPLRFASSPSAPEVTPALMALQRDEDASRHRLEQACGTVVNLIAVRQSRAITRALGHDPEAAAMFDLQRLYARASLPKHLAVKPPGDSSTRTRPAPRRSNVHV